MCVCVCVYVCSCVCVCVLHCNCVCFFKLLQNLNESINTWRDSYVLRQVLSLCNCV